GEVLSAAGYLPEVRELEKPMTVARAREALGALVRQAGLWGGTGPTPDPSQRLATAGLVALAYPRCKERLIAAGRPAAEVEAMPTVQVVLLDTLGEFQRLRDDHFKAFYLPFPEARPLIERASREMLRVVADNPQNAVLRVLAALIPAVDKVHQSAGRTER